MINILLIDQEPLFQQAFSRMIAETEECQLIGIAENSKEAFEIASRYHPQIVFCDVVLGMENGIALCNLIKEHFPEITTYILSNYCSFQMIRHSMDAGVEEYLYKPLSRKKLSELIERNNASSLNEEENLQHSAIVVCHKRSTWILFVDFNYLYVLPIRFHGFLSHCTKCCQGKYSHENAC